MTGRWRGSSATALCGRVPRIFATLLTIVAIVSALSALGGAIRSGVRPFRETIDILLLPAPANLAYAAFLGVLAAAVARRKRIAFWVLVVYFWLAALLALIMIGLLTLVSAGQFVNEAGEELFTNLDRVVLFGGLAFALAALLTLALAQREFYARVRKGSLWRALAVLVAAVAAGIGLGRVLLSAFPGTLAPGDEPSYAVEKVRGGAAPFGPTPAG